MAARTSSVPSPRTGMFKVRFTSPVFDRSHGLDRAKRRKTHTKPRLRENDLSRCRRQNRSQPSGLRAESTIQRATGNAQGSCDLGHRLIGMLHQMPRLSQLSR